MWQFWWASLFKKERETHYRKVKFLLKKFLSCVRWNTRMGTPEQTKGLSSLVLCLLQWPVADLWRGRNAKAKVNLQQYFPWMLPKHSENSSSAMLCIRSGVSMMCRLYHPLGWQDGVRSQGSVVQGHNAASLLCSQLTVLRVWQEGPTLVFLCPLLPM